MVATPSEAEMIEQIRDIIKKAFEQDTIDQLTKRVVRKQLEQRFGLDLEDQKLFLGKVTLEQVNKILEEFQKKELKGKNKPKSKPNSPPASRKRDRSEGKASPSSKQKFQRTIGQRDEEEDDYVDTFSELEDDSSIASRRQAPKKPSHKPSSSTSSSPKKMSGKGNASRKMSKSEANDAAQRLAKLKQLVAACGVRKPWKKQYEAESVSEDDYAGQCRVVQRVLRDLGMTGRGSLEQAKKIRQEREFKDELAALQEDPVIKDPSWRGRQARASADGVGDSAGKKRTVVVIDDEDTGSASDAGDSDNNHRHSPRNKPPRTPNRRARRGIPTSSTESDDDGPPRKKTFKSALVSFVADLNSDSD